MRFFASSFCSRIIFPKPLIIAIGSFQIFSNIRGDICKSRCTTGINDTGGKFATNTASVVDTCCKFATGVNDTGGKEWEHYQTADTLT